jgi:hypothetical protein
LSQIEKPSLPSGRKTRKEQSDVKLKGQNNADHLLMPMELFIINLFYKSQLGILPSNCEHLERCIYQKRLNIWTEKRTLHHDNMPFQEALSVKQFLVKGKIKLLEHPLQSLICPHMTYSHSRKQKSPEGLILNHLRTFRAVC